MAHPSYPCNKTSSLYEGDVWAVNDSPFENYVSMVNFREGSAKELITSSLGKSDTNTAIDIAGGLNGRALIDLIDQGWIGRGVFTNLTENREIKERRPNNVKCVTGDLTSDSTWKDIGEAKREIAPQGFNLALHRPYGGLQDLKPEYYIEGVLRVMELLTNGGVFYAQIPVSPYEQVDNRKLDNIFWNIKKSPAVESIEVSDRSRTLSNHNFCLIYKK